jgi:tetratricopeptide (TPR) repeat protein
MAGQFEEAIENYQQILKLRPSPSLAGQARSEINRLKNTPAPFSDKLLQKVRVSAEARTAFKMGLRLARRKKLKQSIRYLRAALILDPMLPGTYRVLGATYGKLGNPAKEREFLQYYLRIRPDGKIADIVRKRLKPTGLLNQVALAASFPCEVWVNGRPLGKNTPVKELLLPSGNHTVSFVSEKYHIIRNKRIRLGTGQKTRLRFAFGVLQLKLKPWARVRANRRDLGLWDTLGLPVGEYDLVMTAHNNSRKKNQTVMIRPGKIVAITKW